MKPALLLRRLQELGVEVSKHGERLHLEAPRGRLTPALKADLLAHKADLLRFLERAEEDGAPGLDGNRRLVTLQPRGKGAPLVLVHPIGGDVFCYAKLVEGLGRDRPILALRAPGLAEDEEPVPVLESLAEEHVSRLRRDRRTGPPFLLAGWSTGGVLALETARRLRAGGEEVPFVGLLDSYLSQRRDRSPGAMLRLFSKELGLSLEGAALDQDRLLESSEEEAIELLVEYLERTQALGGELDAAGLRRRLRVFRAGLRAFDDYRGRPYPGQVTLFQARERRGDDRLERTWEPWVDRLALHRVPGTHDSMLRPPCVDTVARRLRSALAAADRGP